MKKLFIILIAVAVGLGAYAQRGHGFGHGYGGGYFYRPHFSIGFGAYSPLYPYYGYNPLYGYPYYGYSARPSRLTLHIEDIKNDYKDRIRSARQDKSISRKQRREKIHELRVERDREILEAKRDYYKK